LKTIFAIGACLLPGCIPVVPHYSASLPTRSNVEWQLRDFPVPGTSTREEVLLRFGEPDATRHRQATFVYRWRKMIGLIPGYWSSTPIPADFELEIDFDERGVVSALRGNGMPRAKEEPQKP
jgi:hypothetical protein